MNYRSEIDGLRALAVLPVIFFHAGLGWFNGGFIGVDIFFVISGYLITSIILHEMAEQKFSLIGFYERRARRILPALFFIMLVCLPFSWVLLTPSDLENFGLSLIAVSSFTSNILFWLQSGYFETAAELKPLLHTWSLAVEEQYYIIFPLFLILCWRLGRGPILILLLVALLLSLSVAHWGAFNKPSATFFLLPTRGWELLIGVFLAFYLKEKSYIKSHYLNQALSLIGLLMVLYSLLFFDKSTPFPSLYALVPTIGTGLLILSAVENTLVNKFLSIRPIVGIGLISYSAYLWHQPVLVFTRHAFPSSTSSILFFVLSLVSIIMGYLSWRFVEKPFRDRSKLSRKIIFSFSMFGILFFSLTGYNFYSNNGHLKRLNVNEAIIYDFIDYDTSELYREGNCFLKVEQDANQFSKECMSGKFLVWGDSHAAALSSGLRKVGDFSQLTGFACPPILFNDFIGRPNCKENNKYIFEKIKNNSFKKLIIHSNWIGYDLEDISNFKITLNELAALNNDLEIYILGGVPQWQPSLPRYLVNSRVLFKNIEADLYIRNSKFLTVKERDVFIQNIVIETNENRFKFISLIEELCIEDKCIAVKDDGTMQPYVWDYGHLTESGTNALANILLSKLDLNN
jgi:peptidoglycan/LPS O-acetylase OafA/YrhL